MSRFPMKYGLWIIMVTLLFSCSTIRTEPDEKTLHERAEKLWQAKMEGDRETIYNMSVESYREKVELKRFLRGPLINIISFSIQEIKTDLPDAQVTVNYRFSHQGFEFDAIAKDQWVWENENWYLKMKPLNLPF